MAASCLYLQMSFHGITTLCGYCFSGVRAEAQAKFQTFREEKKKDLKWGHEDISLPVEVG